jgi:mannose/fructose/N-acetylgalactosamine-specific phosphotransferase system component IID
MVLIAAVLLVYVFIMLVTAYVLGYLEGREVIPELAHDEAMFLCFAWPIAIIFVLGGVATKIMNTTRKAGRKE